MNYLSQGSASHQDTTVLRKARGAFFTPQPIAKFITAWALRRSTDAVMEPSTGDAAFLVEAVDRLKSLATDASFAPHVEGVEIHPESAEIARRRIEEAGGTSKLQVTDFFLVEPTGKQDAVIGNPPYIRYQDFSGENRARAREAALKGGVALSGLASSWAAFTVHSALFLKESGRLGLVLPAELLSVNYAAPVRQFLFENFGSIDLVLFDQQVFPEAEADVVLLLADGYRKGPTDHARFRRTFNADSLGSLTDDSLHWTPPSPLGKWTSSLVSSDVSVLLNGQIEEHTFGPLQDWGETTLGMVTGNNKFFTLSPERVKQLGLGRNETLRLSPPGSSHLRGLQLTNRNLNELGLQGRATHLFYPSTKPSTAALSYIRDGERTGVNTAYKCRTRKEWYRVPLVPPADLLLTYMNADTPRLSSNVAKVRHLNSVHGVYLKPDFQSIGLDLLPLASLNTLTLLSAEMVGRAYGGGILKLEPKEADSWLVPSPSLVTAHSVELREVKERVARLLRMGRLHDAVDIVDGVLIGPKSGMQTPDLELAKDALHALSERRRIRGNSGK